MRSTLLVMHVRGMKGVVPLIMPARRMTSSTTPFIPRTRDRARSVVARRGGGVLTRRVVALVVVSCVMLLVLHRPCVSCEPFRAPSTLRAAEGEAPAQARVARELRVVADDRHRLRVEPAGAGTSHALRLGALREGPRRVQQVAHARVPFVEVCGGRALPHQPRARQK